MRNYAAVNFSARVGVALLACALVFSFGLHMLDTHHTHPTDRSHTHHEPAGQTDMIVLSEYAHMGEKKFFAGVASVFLFLVVAYIVASTLRRLCAMHTRSTHLQLSDYMRQKTYRWEQEFFARGILHPKLH